MKISSNEKVKLEKKKLKPQRRTEMVKRELEWREKKKTKYIFLGVIAENREGKRAVGTTARVLSWGR